MDYPDQGENKRSAYDAGFENHQTPEEIPPNAVYEYAGNSFEPDQKRACYPDPSPYSAGPYHPQNINFDHHVASPLPHPSSSSSYGHFATSSPSISYLDSSPHNQLATSHPHHYGAHSSPVSDYPQQSPHQSLSVPDSGFVLPRPSPAHASSPFAIPEISETSPLPLRTTRRPLTRLEAARRRGPRLTPARRIGGVSFEAAGLSLPANLDPMEVNRRQGELDRELQRQVHNPPVLPPSEVEDVEPKEAPQAWVKVPDDDGEEKRKAIQQNNEIAAYNQTIERRRNNQAAKKSRKKRVEALNNTREILNRKCAECDWWRMKAMTLGAKSQDWEFVPETITDKMISDIADRVRKIDDERAEIKKKEDILKRTKRKRDPDVSGDHSRTLSGSMLTLGLSQDEDASSRQETPASDYSR